MKLSTQSFLFAVVYAAPHTDAWVATATSVLFVIIGLIFLFDDMKNK